MIEYKNQLKGAHPKAEIMLRLDETKEVLTMNRKRGGFMTLAVIIIAIALLCGTGYFAAGAMKNRNAKAGMALLDKGDYTQAAVMLEKAKSYSLRPDAEILFALGSARLHLGEKSAAKSCFEKVVAIEPANAKARFELGRIYLSDQNYGAAKSEIKALEELGTDEARRYADELKEARQTGAVKGFFNELFKKILPGVPDVLGNILPEGEKDGGETQGN